jgi:hypothetical protein
VSALVASTILASCAGSARTPADYRLKARHSAKAALSAVQTSMLAARLVRDDDAFSTYVSVVLDSAERDVTSVESTFSSIQSPSASSDHLRDELDQVLNNAAGTISSMRIAARRDEWRSLLVSAHDLPKLALSLQPYTELSP